MVSIRTFLLLPLAIAAAHPLVSRNNVQCTGCTFTISSPGEGQVGQLADGQNRLNQKLPAAQYCIKNGMITDGSGRGCYFTPPTGQFQCDTGGTPAGGISIGCDGTISENGSDQFYECPTGDQGGYNIYFPNPPSGQQGCSKIKLIASGCGACPAPKTCPTNLNGPYQFPHLIVPVNSAHPNQAYGTQYDATVCGTESSLFLFDIPPSYTGKTCSLVFFLPTQAQLQTSSFTLSGTGSIDFAELATTVTQQTTYNNMGKPKADYGYFTVSPGHSYLITTFACPANSQLTFELSPGCDTCLTYFQDFNPSPIGLYITTC